MSRKPALFTLDTNAAFDPATAPSPPDTDHPEGRAMGDALRIAQKRPSHLTKLVWAAVSGLVLLIISVSVWDFVIRLMSRSEALGVLAIGLATIVVVAALVVTLREIMGFHRLRRIDRMRRQAEAARNARQRTDAVAVANALMSLYSARPDLRWPTAQLREDLPDQLDSDGVLDITETHLMAPLDARAIAQIETSARQVAMLTALIPMALVDVLAALVTNLRMIRRIAEIYGGRTGALGSLRLLRGVVAHLLATGAVAVGEDMLGAVASGGVMSKLSRRFGEGVVNGALTARLGIAAIEVCRPLPFAMIARPRTSSIMRRAVSGLFDKPAP